ncbi:hypothetical protein C1645_744971 [Glomus cerebriforme]|uniref:Uncharacterized protein n=1 Tax=Glomus cerebriforme TaxID=658196 RepID=A0A397SA25_9GLOM|nr:hypothetical protein C1645_744971 [Glomus cerebriforme]
MKILLEDNGGRNGICERFTKRDETDRNSHPIPLLANGPGTGKSRFLQEIPILLREQIENCTREREEMRKRKIEIEIEKEEDEEIREKEHVRKEDRENDNELLNRIKDRMYAVNVTFGNGTPVNSIDVLIDETSVTLRILYEHFISGGKCEYDDFVNHQTSSSDQADHHSGLEKISSDQISYFLSKQNPVRLIVHAVGGLNCSSRNIFYVSILAGTIQGPLEEMFKESTYHYLPLPLRLLQSQEVQNISEFVSKRNSLGDYINSGTFRHCISDFGGQVQALEIFYYDLLKKLKRGTNNVDYVHCMSHVKEELMD